MGRHLLGPSGQSEPPGKAPGGYCPSLPWWIPATVAFSGPLAAGTGDVVGRIRGAAEHGPTPRLRTIPVVYGDETGWLQAAGLRLERVRLPSGVRRNGGGVGRMSRGGARSPFSGPYTTCTRGRILGEGDSFFAILPPEGQHPQDPAPGGPKGHFGRCMTGRPSALLPLGTLTSPDRKRRLAGRYGGNSCRARRV